MEKEAAEMAAAAEAERLADEFEAALQTSPGSPPYSEEEWWGFLDTTNVAGMVDGFFSGSQWHADPM